MVRAALLALLVALAPVALAGGAAPGASPPVVARAVRLDPGDPARRTLGRLAWLGGWELSSRDRRFGGLSALVAVAPGRLLALSDAAVPVAIDVSGPVPRATLLPVLDTGADARSGKSGYDSESLVRDPATGAFTVGLERRNSLLGYDSRLRLVRRVRPAAMQTWPANDGAEAMARLADGRLLVIAERVAFGRDGREALLFADDPLAWDARPPLRLGYRPPAGYDPSDMAVLPDGRLVVLNRRATLMDGFSAVLTLVDPAGARAGAMLEGREVARLAAPLTVDNMEGIAVVRENGRTVLWLVSDDNFLPFERTLLLKFALAS